MRLLKHAIEKYQQSMQERLSQNEHKIIQASKNEIKSRNLLNHVLKPGREFPEFLLTSTEGARIDNSVFAKHAFSVISFYRGKWSPYCVLELQALKELMPELEALDAQLIAISPQTIPNSIEAVNDTDLPFMVLSDPQNKISNRCGLAYTVPQSIRSLYESSGIDLIESNNDKSFELPLPATFIVDNGGFIRYVFVDEDYTKRLEPSMLLGTLKVLSSIRR